MKYVAPVRAQLGFRTIFNLLGPLTNPAGAEYQLIGANRTTIAEKLAGTMARLGTGRTLVVCGADQLDEVALWGETVLFDVKDGEVTRRVWNATMLGLDECTPDDLRVSSAGESASVIREVLDRPARARTGHRGGQCGCGPDGNRTVRDSAAGGCRCCRDDRVREGGREARTADCRQQPEVWRGLLARGEGQESGTRSGESGEKVRSGAAGFAGALAGVLCW